MTDPARQLLEEIRDELAAIRRHAEAWARAEDGTPLSRAEFCRILGIDLKSTLEPLIKARKVRTVPWTRGEVRIPVAELRRFQRDGIPSLEAQRKSPPAARAVARDDSDEDFRSIPIK